jgi:hypothetical protein
MLAKNLLGKHTALRTVELRYILPVEMVNILETGILCISLGFHNRILLLRILCIWCPSPHSKEANGVSETGSVGVQMKGREGTDSLRMNSLDYYVFSVVFISVGLKSVRVPTLSSGDENRMFPRKLDSLLNIRHWTNSRNPVILIVVCRHQNALGLTEFCYWGYENPISGKISRIYSESINQTLFFFTVGLAIAKYGYSYG